MTPNTHYASGDEIRVGDRVAAGAWSGVVVFVLGTAAFAPGHDPAAWSYLGRGVMVEFEQVGLVFYNTVEADLVLLARA
jgi:hypothetical protein